MTDTTPLPLTEADVLALGYTPFGYERDDRMGSVLAHKDGEAFYLCRRGAFWSLDPEYSNMRGVLCEEVPYWREFRRHCDPRLIVDTDVLVWSVSDLPVERAERLFNYHTIAPVLAGLRAQAEVVITKNLGETKNHEPKVVVEDLALPYTPPAPAPRRPLKVGDRIVVWHPDTGFSTIRRVLEVVAASDVSGASVDFLRIDGSRDDVLWLARLAYLLPDAEG